MSGAFVPPGMIRPPMQPGAGTGMPFGGPGGQPTGGSNAGMPGMPGAPQPGRQGPFPMGPPPAGPGTGMPGMPGMPGPGMPGPGMPGMVPPPGGIRPPGPQGFMAPPVGPMSTGGMPPSGMPLPGQAPGSMGPGRPMGMPPAPFSTGGPMGPGMRPSGGMPPGPGMPPGGMPPFRPPGGPPGMPQAGPGGMPPQQPPQGMMAGPPGMPPPPPGMMPGPPGMPPPPLGGMMGGPPGPPGMMPPPGAPGMMPPPGQAPYGGMGAGGYDPYGAQRMMEQFESITLGAAGPGHPEGTDLLQLPRPTGEARAAALAAQPPSDPGNCAPHNMRLTVNGIPNSTALRARWSMPIGLIVHPMADEALGREVPVVNLGNAGIVRCRRCRTYMNPFVQWTDSGRRFRCNVCALLNEVPVEYFCNLDHDGRRNDLHERPELSGGTVEYIAPAEYMVRPPMPPVYFFVIDVTYSAVMSGMVAATCRAIKASLDGLPGDERTRVGFLTFDSNLHFYNLKATLSQPQMLVVTELDEPFVPLPDDLLVNLRESRTVVDALLDLLPANFAANTNVDSATGPALQAAFMVMAHLGGKMLLFQSSVPSLGIGKIKARDNPQAYGTDREAALRNPDDAFYKRFAAECSRVQISVDVFAFSGQYMDLASLSAIPQYTCGEVYHYPGFVAARDEAKLAHEVGHNLTRPTAWEAVMRIRCSKGLRISSFHGHFFNRSTDLLALPTCDPDKAFAVQIAHEENMLTATVSFVQCALLYTNSNGERRIRVHTLAVPVVGELSDLYNGADSAATACLTAKLAVEKALVSHLEETRQMVQQKLISLLKEFRMMNASAPRQPNKLIYPPTLRNLPLWTLGLLRSAAFRGGAKDVSADERIVAMHWVMEASVEDFCRLAYPTLYPVHDPAAGPWGEPDEQGRVQLPPTSPASLQLLLESGAYLIDNGRVFILWIGRAVSREWVAEVLGSDPQTLDPGSLSVEPARSSALSQRLNRVLGALRARRPIHQQCMVVRQGTPQELARIEEPPPVAPPHQVNVWQFLVEDRLPTQPSYSDFMMALHRGVMSK